MPYLWEKSYPDDVDYRSAIETGLIHEILQETSQNFPNHLFMNFLGKKYTYAEAQVLVDKLATGLQQLGVKKGVNVGLFLPNTPTYILFFFAILKAGGTVVSFNVLLAPEEISEQIKSSDIKFLVTHDIKELSDKVLACLGKTQLEKIILCPLRTVLTPFKSLFLSLFKSSLFATIPQDDKIIDYKSLLKDVSSFRQPKISLKHIAVLQYTGGTTGRSKAAMLTHENLSANVDMALRLATKIRLNGKECYLAVLPFFHIFGLVAGLIIQVKIASSIYFMFPRFNVDQAIKLIKKHKITVLMGVPTMFSALAKHTKARWALKSVHSCISGGDSLYLSTKTAFEKASGGVLVEGYGLTEASLIVSMNPQSGLNKENSIGLPAPGCEVKILDLDDDHFVDIEEKGEICVKGPNVMKGYYNNPKATKNIMYKGFLRTGDVGYMDQDGYLYIVDRTKDLIKVSGYNVYPRHVEEAIYKHPAIAEVIVLGVPDKYQQQHVNAYVVLKKNQSVTQEELLAFLVDKLSPHERPKEIIFRPSLPKTLIGKLSKSELMQEIYSKGD